MPDKDGIQRFVIRKLMNFKPPKWGASHTEGRNLLKGLPKHLIGMKFVKDAVDELVKSEFLLKTKKTGEWHYSLNPRKQEDIFKFVNLE
jgi:hypothetical protein